MTLTYCGLKNICVSAIIVPELKLRNVQRRILAAYIMVAAHAPLGHDTRVLQAYLGHRNIQHAVRYREITLMRFLAGVRVFPAH
jgi:hypothetical protein